MRHSAISRYHWLSGRMSAEFNVRQRKKRPLSLTTKQPRATNKETEMEDNLITVTGMLSGSINGVAVNGTVTGTADKRTGRVTNIFHDIDPAIGRELSSIGIGQTIVCAHMAIEEGAARNLISMAPGQRLQRLATFKLPSHSMQCLQTVAWTAPNAAVVTMEYSGTLPSVSGESLPMPDMQCDFNQCDARKILQRGATQAPIGDNPQTLSVEIEYSIMGAEKIAWPACKSQLLENAKNTSSYDEKSREVTYNTYVRMLEG
jgi:hypothetical protein